MELVILCGVRASGKTSFWRGRLARTHERVAVDAGAAGDAGGAALEAAVARVRGLLGSGRSVVVDGCNLTAAERGRLIAAARDAAGERGRVRVVGYLLETTLGAAVARNATRGSEARVAPTAIRGAVARLELPSPGEGFDALYAVRLAPGGFGVRPWRVEAGV